MNPRPHLPAIEVWDAALPGRWQRYPVELNAAARALGAQDVLYRAQTQGYTRWLDTGPSIMLALTRSDGRRRATLAHECAHLILDPLVGAEAFRQMDPTTQVSWRDRVRTVLGAALASRLSSTADQVGLERTCDLLSHELLMPSAWARSIRRAWGGDVTGLRDLATAHRLSLSMTMIRLNEVGPARVLLTLKQTPGGRWLAVRTVGAPVWLRARVHCTFEEPDAAGFSGERQIEVVVTTSTRTRRVTAAATCAGATRILLVDRCDLEHATAANGSLDWFADDCEGTASTGRRPRDQLTLDGLGAAGQALSPAEGSLRAPAEFARPANQGRSL